MLQLIQAMKSQCELQESDLPQEEFEGVDPSEWVCLVTFHFS